MASPRLRIAPSPTGLLHVGTARTALFNWLVARQSGGVFILRMEDTDAGRNQAEAIDGIQRSLHWLGLDWDEGPYFQSERTMLYAVAAARLFEKGQAYWCSCSREEIDARARARGGPPGYDRHCRDLELGPAPGRVLRFRTPADGFTTFADVVRHETVVENAHIEDFSLVKGNGDALFILANMVDDEDMTVTHVVRGEDHLTNTAKYVLLWQALSSLPLPVFAHLPLLVNEQRKKLSKRRDKVALEQFRDEGYLPEVMVNYLALLGWGPGDNVERFTLPELVERFRLEDVVPSPAFFDLKKLTAFNGDAIRAMPTAEFVERSEPWLRGAVPGFEPPWPPERYDATVFERMAPVVQPRVTTLAEVPGYVDFLVFDDPVVDESAWAKTMTPEIVPLLDAVMTTLASPTLEWRGFGRPEEEELAPLAVAVFAEGEGLGLNRRLTQAPIRLAVTGRPVGPPLFESLDVLGRHETLRRLRAARARLA